MAQMSCAALGTYLATQPHVSQYTASSASNATRSRPLCPYPKTLRYNGSGEISQASSYACQ